MTKFGWRQAPPDFLSKISWYPVVEELVAQASEELKICEHLLNYTYLCDFPQIHSGDWVFEQDIDRINRDYTKCKDKLDSVYEVTGMIENTIILTEFNTNRIYHLQGIPTTLISSGMIMSGIIGKKGGELYWKWYHTDGFYPQRGKKYIKLIS